ncbi:hypothetical protein AQUCO_00300502v1 [Aquilegia coerulea]|uniref:Uncharacterized protein n=2 Tax=Aquilegia coerulea TaxID=218851 RepID=A0A2G5EZ63_AQUCA|nr:hypothetical protein AQUCO_00300502v1 [Aquilegia coerulea]
MADENNPPTTNLGRINTNLKRIQTHLPLLLFCASQIVKLVLSILSVIYKIRADGASGREMTNVYANDLHIAMAVFMCNFFEGLSSRNAIDSIVSTLHCISDVSAIHYSIRSPNIPKWPYLLSYFCPVADIIIAALHLITALRRNKHLLELVLLKRLQQ